MLTKILHVELIGYMQFASTWLDVQDEPEECIMSGAIGGIGAGMGIGTGMGVSGGLGNLGIMGGPAGTASLGAHANGGIGGGGTAHAATPVTTVSISAAGTKALASDNATAGATVPHEGLKLSAGVMGIGSGLQIDVSVLNTDTNVQSQNISDLNRLDKIIAALLLALLAQSHQQENAQLPVPQYDQQSSAQISAV